MDFYVDEQDQLPLLVPESAFQSIWSSCMLPVKCLSSSWVPSCEPAQRPVCFNLSSSSEDFIPTGLSSRSHVLSAQLWAIKPCVSLPLFFLAPLEGKIGSLSPCWRRVGMDSDNTIHFVAWAFLENNMFWLMSTSKVMKCTCASVHVCQWLGNERRPSLFILELEQRMQLNSHPWLSYYCTLEVLILFLRKSQMEAPTIMQAW